MREGVNNACSALNKALIERLLGTEMALHLGYPHGATKLVNAKNYAAPRRREASRFVNRPPAPWNADACVTTQEFLWPAPVCRHGAGPHARTASRVHAEVGHREAVMDSVMSTPNAEKLAVLPVGGEALHLVADVVNLRRHRRRFFNFNCRPVQVLDQARVLQPGAFHDGRMRRFVVNLFVGPTADDDLPLAEVRGLGLAIPVRLEHRQTICHIGLARLAGHGRRQHLGQR